MARKRKKSGSEAIEAPVHARPGAPAAGAPPDAGAAARMEAVGALLWAVLLFVPLAWVLARLTPEPDLSAARAALLVKPTNFNPEPAERRLFLFGLLFFPLAFAAYAWLVRAGKLRLRALGERAEWVALAVGAAGVLAVSSAVKFFYWKTSALGTAPWFAALAIACALAGWKLASGSQPLRVWLSRAVTVGVPVVLLSIYVLSSVFDHRDPYPAYPDGHFESVYFSLARTWLGVPPLVECGNQYGLYPLFLSPVFRVLGLSVFKYALVMSLLGAGAGLALLAVARHLVRGPVLATALWGTSFSLSVLCLRPYVRDFMVERLGSFFIDPYFQYVPLRTLVPSLVLLLGVLRVSRPWRWTRWAGSAVAAFGLFWNLDSGIVGWGAWLLFGAYLAALEATSLAGAAKGVARTAAVEIGAVAVAFGVLQAVFLLSGFTPDWSNWFRYQALFYGAGINMLPLRPFHPWLVPAAVLLLALSHSVVALVRGRATTRDALVFLLAVLGAGVFSYYQGRSHNWSLPGVTYPAWLLAGAYLGGLWPRGGRFVRVVAAAGLAAGVATGVVAGWQMRDSISTRLSLVAAPPQELDRDLAFLRQRLQGRPALILSYQASILHAATGTQPLYCPAISELMTREDMDRLAAMLRDAGDRPVVFDDDFLRTIGKRPHLRAAVDALNRWYDRGESSPSGRIHLARRRAPDPNRQFGGQSRGP